MSSLEDHKKVLDYLLDLNLKGDSSRIEFVLRTLANSRNPRIARDPVSYAAISTVSKSIDAWAALRGRPIEDLLDVPTRDVDPSFAALISGKPIDTEAKAKPKFELTSDQKLAWSLLKKWLATDNPYFVLKGYSGTGKSFLQQELNQLPGHNFHFSAPTNKAAKVLSGFIGERCPTTHSILGLRMVEDGEAMSLKASGRAPDLGTNPILVIDEAGMVNKDMVQLLVSMVERKGWRIIFVGDPAQLNPIGEPFSRVWTLADPDWRVLMKEVKRFDNDLLKLSIRIRKRLQNKNYDSSPIKNQNDGNEGVFTVPRRDFINEIKSFKLEDFAATKIGVWRNKTVKRYTEIVRENLGFKEQYEPSDLIMMGSPILSESGTIVAYTDEEFQINNIVDRTVSIDGVDVDARQMSLIDSDLSLLVPKRPEQVNDLLAERARDANAADGLQRKLKWKRFWELKRRFHNIRHGYAMTAHRLQGSTLDNIFIDQSDVLANQDEREAFRALYVLATRPRFKLTTF